MSKSIHTMPAKARNAVRKPNAPCKCGWPAKSHVNHIGPCPYNGCARWTWTPSK